MEAEQSGGDQGKEGAGEEPAGPASGSREWPGDRPGREAGARPAEPARGSRD